MTTQTATTREKPMDQGVQETDERSAFYGRASGENLAPLWKVLSGLVGPKPLPKAVPFRWRYTEVLPFLMEACALITAEEAERRVLILENPALRGMSRALDSLFAGLQIILPGEVAPAHRHVASALRFIIDGENAYTAVDGERTMMSPGDFVITPSWTWHDHGSFGDRPMVWLDGLDMHIVNLLSASFREELEFKQYPINRPDDSTLAEFGYSMAPDSYQHERTGSPIVNYTYARAKEALAAIEAHRAIDPHQGHKLNYLNPMTGDWAMTTLATSMRKLPAGFTTAPYQSTDSTVFVVVEGEGVSRIGGEEFDWKEHDVIVAPSWALQEHEARRDSTLFSYSDRATQEKLHLWREKRHTSAS